MLIESAVGDAFASVFEFASDDFVAKNNSVLGGYVENPDRKDRTAKYTDDTQMAMALTEAMLLGIPWEPKYIAAKFLEVFKRDPRSGYARRFEKLLVKCNNVDELLATLMPNSERSGAAMRSPPLGLIRNIKKMIQHCGIQASITHDTSAGIAASIASAGMTHYFAYRLGPKKDLGKFLESIVEGPWSIPYEGAVGNVGWECVMAAATAVMANGKMTTILKSCIDFTGDVDTVASIALAAASMSDEVKYDLPMPLMEGLENGPYGRRYIMSLDIKLMGMFGFTPKYLSGDLYGA